MDICFFTLSLRFRSFFSLCFKFKTKIKIRFFSISFRCLILSLTNKTVLCEYRMWLTSVWEHYYAQACATYICVFCVCAYPITHLKLLFFGLRSFHILCDAVYTDWLYKSNVNFISFDLNRQIQASASSLGAVSKANIHHSSIHISDGISFLFMIFFLRTCFDTI